MTKINSFILNKFKLKQTLLTFRIVMSATPLLLATFLWLCNRLGPNIVAKFVTLILFPTTFNLFFFYLAEGLKQILSYKTLKT